MCVLLVFLILISYVSASSECEQDHLVVGQTCSMEWKHLNQWLHPTQPAIGFAWAIKKAESYKSSQDAQEDFDGRVIPVVIGPSNGNQTDMMENITYVVDGHHSLCALDRSSYSNTKVKIKILCNWSNLSASEFWREMRAAGFAYLNSHPKTEPNTLPLPISSSELPQRFKFNKDGTSFLDDPWRSLGGFVRKVQALKCPKGDKYCGRGYKKVCTANNAGIPFFEFRWGFFLNKAYSEYSSSGNATLWNGNEAAASRFATVYGALPVPVPSPSFDVDVDAWMDAAALLVPLCRGHSARSYLLPIENFPFSSSHFLPGFVDISKGPIVSTSDPMCDPPSCPACLSMVSLTKRQRQKPDSTKLLWRGKPIHRKNKVLQGQLDMSPDTLKRNVREELASYL